MRKIHKSEQDILDFMKQNPEIYSSMTTVQEFREYQIKMIELEDIQAEKDGYDGD